MLLYEAITKNSPGVLLRKIGGGGTFVPLIGDTQQFSSISCCKTDRYEEMIQNSSKLINIDTSQFFSSTRDEFIFDEVAVGDDDDSFKFVVVDDNDDDDS